jgi:3-oxoacyl-[acyl-carrier protein] reductase
MIDPGLRGRGVLVTGANNPRGIGAAIAKSFARAGARVFLHYHPIPREEGIGDENFRELLAQSCDEVLEQVRAAGAEAAAYEADFGNPGGIPAVFDAAERFCGSVDVLVNNAATWVADTFLPEAPRSPFLELWSDRAPPISAEASIRQFVVDAVAPALLMREFAARHVERGSRWGRIINISTAGSHCFPSEVSYGASKYALESLTRSAAYELGQLGITVNALALGPVQTGWITPELEKAILPTIPLGRIGTPEDIADVVLFFASEQARWVTGQRMLVSGGHAM